MNALEEEKEKTNDALNALTQASDPVEVATLTNRVQAICYTMGSDISGIAGVEYYEGVLAQHDYERLCEDVDDGPEDQRPLLLLDNPLRIMPSKPLSDSPVLGMLSELTFYTSHLLTTSRA
jgi:hypothetical protein